MKVYMTGLLPLTSGEFSIDAGANWQAANIGSNGFSFNTPITNANVTILARAAGNNSTIINTNYHASCSTIPPADWGINTVLVNGSNTCKYVLNVLGLSIDSYAEFSLDSSTWFKASNGNNNFQFILLQGSPGSTQNFYFRPAENTSFVKQTTLSTCTN